ncbi:MAG: hypothetical protein P4L42_01250 [Desulfocapsaceae bacterium]|nr:hypothetical protein [Desulfocapsaceae bacterium]
MKCPQCKHIQQGTVECESCGIIFTRYYKHLVKVKFNQAVQKYHAQEFDAALKIFNAIVGVKIPKDKEIVRECRDYISLINGNLAQKTHGLGNQSLSEIQNTSQETGAQADIDLSIQEPTVMDFKDSFLHSQVNLHGMNKKFKYLDITIRFMAFISLIPLFWAALILSAMTSGGPKTEIFRGHTILSIAGILIFLILFSILKPEILSVPFSRFGQIRHAIGRAPAYIYAPIGLYLGIRIIIEPIYYHIMSQ